MSSWRLISLLAACVAVSYACVGGPGPLPTEGIGQGGSAGTGQERDTEQTQNGSDGTPSSSGGTTTGCQPGSTLSCRCGDLSGLRQCNADGRAYGACICEAAEDAAPPIEFDAG